MNRRERRRQALEIQKKYDSLSASEKERYHFALFENASSMAFELVEAELRESFGFGDKRIEKLFEGVRKRAEEKPLSKEAGQCE